jgi:hypothetical protein
VYAKLFRQLSDVTAPGGHVIVVDCSPHNFFASIGMPNPFAPTIEWQKHQTPETWAKLLSAPGFTDPNISWLTFNGLGRAGRALLGHKTIAYLLRSHFRLEMRKPALRSLD